MGSGGAQLFGTTGGVMEAALRTVYEIVTGQPMGKIVFEVSHISFLAALGGSAFL